MSQKQRSSKEIMLLILFTAIVCLGVLNFGSLVGLIAKFIGMLKPFIIGAAIAFVVNLPLKFIEEKLGVIDYDFAVGITAEITEINDEIIKVKLTLGNSLLRNLSLKKV